MTAGTFGYRQAMPRGMDLVRWRTVRARWNAAAQDRGNTTHLRHALAAEIGMKFNTLYGYARRLGWQIGTNNGRA